MKKFSKQIVSWLLAICMIVATLQPMVFATDGNAVEVYDSNESLQGSYATISDALAALLEKDIHDDGYTIKLLENVEEAVTIFGDASTPFHITMDLNGCTLTAPGEAISIADSEKNQGTQLTVTSGLEGGAITSGATAVYNHCTGYETDVTLKNITVNGNVYGAIHTIDNCKITGHLSYDQEAEMTGTVKNSTIGTSGGSAGMYVVNGDILLENCTIYGWGTSVQIGTSSTKSDLNVTIQGEDTAVCEGAISVENLGTGQKNLTIYNGNFQAEEQAAIYMGASGTLNICGGTFTGGDVSAIQMDAIDGTVNIYDGALVQGVTNADMGSEPCGISVDSGTLNVYGGTINSEDSYGVYSEASTAKITISGGNITGTNGVYVKNSESLDISGDANIKGTSNYSVYANGVPTTITGGTLATESTSSSGKYGVYVTGATADISGDVKISGGSGAYLFGGGTISGGEIIGTVYGVRGSSSAIDITGGYIEGGTYAIYGTGSSVFTFGGTDVIGPTVNGDIYSSVTAEVVTGFFTTDEGFDIADGSYITEDVNVNEYYQVYVVKEPTPEVEVIPEVSDGTASATVPENTSVSADADFTITATADDATTETQVSIPSTVVSELSTASSLVIVTNEATVTFDSDALEDIAKTTEAVTITVQEKATKDYSGDQGDALADSQKILDISITSDGRGVAFDSGTATITTPYVMQANTPSVYYVADDGAKTAVSSTYDNETVCFTTSHFSVYSIEEAGIIRVDYTITVTLDEAEYRSGDTITAAIGVTAPEDSNIGSFDLGLSYDDALMKLVSPVATTGIVSGISSNGALVGYSGTAISVGETVTTLFTSTFTVLEDVSVDSTTITVDGGQYETISMTPSGVNGNAGTITVVSDSAKIIDTVVITLEAGDNGSYTGTASFNMDSGDSLGDVIVMDGYSAPTANSNYAFAGWYAGDALLANTNTFSQNTTITAVFVPDSFAFTSDGGNTATVTPGTGIVDEKATYLTDATFTVAAPSGTILNGVSYTVGDGLAVSLTATESTATTGTYTIEGANITGAINVIVSVVQYHSVTFQAGTGSSMTAFTYYAKEGTANTGLYTTVENMVNGTTTNVEPTYTIDTGYRVADLPWITGTSSTSFDAILLANFTEDTTYTVNTVKTYHIAFAAGDNGSVANTADGTYDTGATVTIPAVSADSGYVFNSWTSSTSTDIDADATSFTASEDVTYTATFTPGTYAVSFPTVSGVTFSDITGLTDGKATYNGDDVTFTAGSDGTVVINSVSYTVSGGEPQTIDAIHGVYTISSRVIIADVSITVSATDVHTVQFVSGSNGAVDGTTSFNVVSGETLSDSTGLTITPNTGYEFSHWTNGAGETVSNPTTVTVTGDETYTANFTAIQYTITADTGSITFVSGYDTYATYGTDVTFTISSDSGIVTGVSLGEGKLTAIDGVYTIPYTYFATTTALELTVTTIFGATMTFIDLDGTYLANVAEAAGRQILLLTVSGDTTGDTTYSLSNGIAMYWSSGYEAYVTIVDDAETVQTLSVGMTSESSAATAVGYDGDLNGDGAIRSDDAGVVNDILHGRRIATTTDMQILMSDITGSKYLATDDVTTIMNVVLGISQGRS